MATIERWIFQEVLQMKLQLDNTKLYNSRITLHQSSYRKRIKSEKFQNICYCTDFADHIVSEERFSCFDDVWINLLLLLFVSPALGMYFIEIMNSLSSYPVEFISWNILVLMSFLEYSSSVILNLSPTQRNISYLQLIFIIYNWTIWIVCS